MVLPVSLSALWTGLADDGPARPYANLRASVGRGNQFLMPTNSLHAWRRRYWGVDEYQYADSTPLRVDHTTSPHLNALCPGVRTQGLQPRTSAALTGPAFGPSCGQHGRGSGRAGTHAEARTQD